MTLTAPDLATTAIETLASSTDLLPLLQASADLARATAAADPDPTLVARLAELTEVDRFATLAAIEALAGHRHPEAGRRLVELLDADDPAVARHATWRLGATSPHWSSLPVLAHRLTMGGIDTLHANRTLRRWAHHRPGRVVATINELLPTIDTGAARARVVDLLGGIDDPTAQAALRVLANDPSEWPAVRQAAAHALDHRPRVHRPAAGPSSTRGRGLRLAQLTLTGQLDPDLSEGGRGDTGGVASLIVSLGEALAQRPEVEQVLTIGRGRSTDRAAGSGPVTDRGLEAPTGHRFASLAVGDDERPWSPTGAWEHLPTIERALEEVLGHGPGIDVLHLRMADVGTLAAVEVAGRLGIDVCFSLAPDPHGLLRSLQAARQLDRWSFVERDHTDHLWFRARLVERLARQASRLALFPRRAGDRLIADLMGPTPPRSIVVPEGIQIDTIRRAEAEVGAGPSAAGAAVGADDLLDDLADRIPAHRRHLPLLISVGRLHPVKGMERVAADWADDPELRHSCNLVIVGGALHDPSPTERSVLEAIDRAVPTGHPAHDGLVLVGGRSRDEVARLLVAAVAGRPGGWGPGGAYVNGAQKEEFGLALIEALAAGLPVVAPINGGPSTFVVDGVNGVLVDTGDDLAPAVRRAFELVDRPGRAQEARAMVEARYSIETMADRLIELYRSSAPAMVIGRDGMAEVLGA